RRDPRRRGAARAAQGDDGGGDPGGPLPDHVGHRHRLGGDAAHRRADGGRDDHRPAAVDVRTACRVPVDATAARAPDAESGVLEVLPVAWWAVFGSGSLDRLAAYAMLTAAPQPVLPPLVEVWTDHLHCIGHSAVVAAVVTLGVWLAMRSLWIPLLGWWAHIVI